MKQTAVELLVQEINKLTGLSISMDEPCVEQAKEMEKEQIIDFGYDIADELACGKYWDKKAMEERYNEYLTFKQQEQ
jgi:hypothetical protein